MGKGVVRGLHSTRLIFVWLNQQKFNLRKIKPARERCNDADGWKSVIKMSQKILSALHRQMNYSWCNRSHVELCTEGKEIIVVLAGLQKMRRI